MRQAPPKGEQPRQHLREDAAEPMSSSRSA